MRRARSWPCRGALCIGEHFRSTGREVHKVYYVPLARREGDRPESIHLQCWLTTLAYVGEPSKSIRFDGGRLPGGYERRDRERKTHSMPASVPHRNEFLAVTPVELDTNVTDSNSNMEYADRPQTGSTASVLPKFHMLPAYGVGEDGRFLGLVNLSTGALLTPEESDTETQLYARLAAADARACVVHGHKLHQCCATCFENKGSKLCRFRCYRAVTAYTEKNSMLTSKIFVHKGKHLVVEPHVILSSADGMMGRLAMVQTHPVEMRTNAWVVMAIRANFDFESIDRVPLTNNLSLIHI